MNNEEVRKATANYTAWRFNFSSHLDKPRAGACVHFFLRITYATGNNSIEKFNGRKHTTMIFVLKQNAGRERETKENEK